MHGIGGASTPPAGAVSERMQALLSRAVEEQVTAERSVAQALAEVRAQVTAVGEGLRGAASGVALERVRSDLATLVGELRASTTSLGDRFDVLARRLDDQGQQLDGTGAGTAELSGRFDAVSSEVAGQAAAVQRLTATIGALAAFPEAMAALQRDIAGLHDRLAPLGDVRAGMADLQARASAAEALKPELEALNARAETFATSVDLNRLRDSIVSAVGDRVAALPQDALTAAQLTEALAPVQERVEALASGGPALERLESLETRLSGLETTLGQIAERLGHIGDAAGGVPALAGDVRRISERIDALGASSEQLTTLQDRVGALHDAGLPTVPSAVAGLRTDLDTLSTRVQALKVPPTTDEVAAAVTARLTDRLVDELTPRITQSVLDRIGPAVALEVAPGVTTGVLDGVRAAGEQTEQRLRTHMDEAILALAEALLRRRRPAAKGGPGTAPALDELIAEAEAAPVAPMTPGTAAPKAPPAAAPTPAAAAPKAPSAPATPARAPESARDTGTA